MVKQLVASGTRKHSWKHNNIWPQKWKINVQKKKIKIIYKSTKRICDNDYYNDGVVTVEQKSQRGLKSQPRFCGWFCDCMIRIFVSETEIDKIAMDYSTGQKMAEKDIFLMLFSEGFRSRVRLVKFFSPPK